MDEGGLMKSMYRNYSGYGRGSGYANRYSSSRGRRTWWAAYLTPKTLNTVANQFIAAAVIALGIIILSNVKNQFTVKILDKARWAVSESYDFKTALSKVVEKIGSQIDKVKNKPDLSKEAFGRTEAFFASTSVMMMPIDGEITSKFGPREKPSEPGVQEVHNGIDIAGEEGAPIKAPLDGVVTKIDENDLLGRSVTIKHSDNIETVYGHLSEVLVDVNQSVKQGDIIAKVGHSGNATAPHLHFEVVKGGKTIDPLTVIGSFPEQL
ncbi:MAG TPA: hypothetical protein DD429_03250 [Clostridiaceae bacterium]|nr:hypothetical protein [Clostridiaceae bacterium]